MEIITRQQAITRRLPSYFTGIPCKHGHVAKRYTQSATCYDCLHPNIKSERKAQGAYRKLARRRMKKSRFRVYNQDFATLKLMVWSFAQLREPALRPADIESRVRPLMITPSKYFETFWIFPEDEPALRDVERNLEAARDILTQPIAPLLTRPSIIDNPAWPTGDPR